MHGIPLIQVMTPSKKKKNTIILSANFKREKSGS